jgi:hypothetical protein
MIELNQNVGFLDRMVRGLLGIDLLALLFFGIIGGPATTLFGLLALYCIGTGIVSFCPLYAVLGRNTRQRTEP